MLQGTIAFDPKLPAAGAPCRATAFTWSAQAGAAAANTVIAGYVGPIEVTGSGSGLCESMTSGDGVLSVRLTGHNPTTGSEVECPSLSGRYGRVLSDTTVHLTGECSVNRFGLGVVLFVGRVQVVPTGAGAGVLTSASTADTVGPFVIVPN